MQHLLLIQHHGYRRDKFKDVINLIVNEENKTEELKHPIYVNEKGTFYISEDDVRNMFDSNLYFDEKYNQIITTSDTKIANIVINENQMIINNSSVSMLDSIIRIDNIVYLPISDMAIVYNIKISYIQSTNRVVIDELNKGLIRAVVTEETKIKFKPRAFSKDIGILKQGETVNCFYTTSKGWRQIRTQDGIVGYIKANKLANEYILRQDMIPREEAIRISKNDYYNKNFTISENETIKKISLKSIYSININDIEVSESIDNDEKESKTWMAVTNKLLKNQTDSILQDYKLRTNLIDIIMKKAIQNDIKGISIDFTEIQNKENILRFVIECTPKFRESGISTCIVLNNNMEENDYINIVDYIVE